MKTTLKYVVVILIAFLGASTEATATAKPPQQIIPDAKGEITLLVAHCFNVPYSSHQLIWEDGALLNFDVEWIRRGQAHYIVPYSEFVALKFYTDEDTPSSLACMYYSAPVLQYSIK